MEIEKIKISGLKHPEVNSRIHPQQQIEEIKKSYNLFGQTRPIIVDEDGEILVGNGFVMAVRELEVDEVFGMIFEGMTRAEKNKLILADNATYNLGANDNQNIDKLLESIASENDFSIPGFDDEVIKTIYSQNKNTDENIKKITEVDEDTARKLEDWDGEPSKRMQRKREEALTAERNMIICPNCGADIEIK